MSRNRALVAVDVHRGFGGNGDTLDVKVTVVQQSARIHAVTDELLQTHLSQVDDPGVSGLLHHARDLYGLNVVSVNVALNSAVVTGDSLEGLNRLGDNLKFLHLDVLHKEAKVSRLLKLASDDKLIENQLEIKRHRAFKELLGGLVAEHNPALRANSLHQGDVGVDQKHQLHRKVDKLQGERTVNRGKVLHAFKRRENRLLVLGDNVTAVGQLDSAEALESAGKHGLLHGAHCKVALVSVYVYMRRLPRE